MMNKEKIEMLSEIFHKVKDDPRFNDLSYFIVKVCLFYDEIPPLKDCCDEFDKTEKTMRRWFNILKEIKVLRKVNDDIGERWEFR